MKLIYLLIIAIKLVASGNLRKGSSILASVRNCCYAKENSFRKRFNANLMVDCGYGYSLPDSHQGADAELAKECLTYRQQRLIYGSAANNKQLLTKKMQKYCSKNPTKCNQIYFIAICIKDGTLSLSLSFFFIIIDLLIYFSDSSKKIIIKKNIQNVNKNGQHQHQP